MIDSSSFYSARLARLSALADFQARLSAIATQDEALIKLLKEATPASVVRFLEEEGTIGDLLNFGQSSRKIVYKENPYGFANSESVKVAFRELERAWKNAVAVAFDFGECNRAEVSITVQ